MIAFLHSSKNTIARRLREAELTDDYTHVPPPPMIARHAGGRCKSASLRSKKPPAGFQTGGLSRFSYVTSWFGCAPAAVFPAGAAADNLRRFALSFKPGFSILPVLERDPLSINARYVLALVLDIARRFDEAIAEAHAGIELDPSNPVLYWSLGQGLAGLRRYDEAVEAFRQATILASGDPLSQGFLGWALGFAGHRQEALTILEDLERRRSQAYVGGVALAYASLGLGDHDRAISWLQQAAEERDGQMTHLNALFLYDPLRADPRFQALLKKMNFPPASPE